MNVASTTRRIVKRKPNKKPTVRLCDFIEQNRRPIVEEWIEFARTLTPWAKGLSKKDLPDHAEELFEPLSAS